MFNAQTVTKPVETGMDIDDIKKGDGNSAILEALKETVPSQKPTQEDSPAQDLIKTRGRILELRQLADKQKAELRKSGEAISTTTPNSPNREEREQDMLRADEALSLTKQTMRKVYEELEESFGLLAPEDIEMIMKATEVEGLIVSSIAQGRMIAKLLNEIEPGWEPLIRKKVREYLDSKIFFGKKHNEKAHSFEDQIEDWLFAVDQRGILAKSEDYQEAQEIYNEWILSIKANKSSYQNSPNAVWLADPYVPIAQGITPIK
jgi:hypothetical protein